MTISAKIILGSISTKTKETITTFELTYPRFIHSELMTHRVFSRNSASSRAIPFKKMLSRIKNDMAMPIHWGANMSGMQAKQEVSSVKKFFAKFLWVLTGRIVLFLAWLMHSLGVHKQVVNRMVEPWSHITVILTTSELENFFELRDHKDAQPEIQELARQMKASVENYEYKKLSEGEWHIPFLTEAEKKQLPLLHQLKVSVARCARVSYLNHDGSRSSLDEDFKLYDRLVGSLPLHASPTEHQATSIMNPNEKKYQGNLSGFIQFRKILEEKNLGMNTNWVAKIFSNHRTK